MEIKISNKHILELSKKFGAKKVDAYNYDLGFKLCFFSKNKYDLVKCILYLGPNNVWFIEKRR